MNFLRLNLKPFFDSSAPSFKSYPEDADKDIVKMEIDSLSKLPYGWDFGSGETIGLLVVDKALEVYEQTNLMGFKIQSFPRSDGGITLSYALKDNFLDVIINPNLTLDLVQEKGIGANYEIVSEEDNVSITDLKKVLHLILSSECPSFELYQSGNTTKTKKDSKAIVSRLWEMEYQFSMPIALESNQDLFATTSEDTMNQQLVPQ